VKTRRTSERVRVFVSGSNRPPSRAETGVLPALELSESEQKSNDALDDEERSIDEVIRKSGLPSSAVSVALLSLEMKRVVNSCPENCSCGIGERSADGSSAAS